MNDATVVSEKSGTKRNYPSTSDESDNSFSGATDSAIRQSKRQNVTAAAQSEMDIQRAIENINKRLECLSQLATKQDIDTTKNELTTLTTTFMDKIQSLEGKVFEIEAQREPREKELSAMKKKNETLLNTVKQQEFRIKQCEREQNELQQYSRRWNLRVFRVPEQEKETGEDCVVKVCRVFSDLVGVKTDPRDIEVAHRAGQRSSTKPRPILVRFFSRQKRDEIMKNRRKLKGKGVSISEDLTPANYKLLTSAFQHSLTLTAWSWNGSVTAKVKNGQTVRLNIHTNLDVAFKRALTSVEVSEDEENH